jgi:hypothetical protein
MSLDIPQNLHLLLPEGHRIPIEEIGVDSPVQLVRYIVSTRDCTRLCSACSLAMASSRNFLSSTCLSGNARVSQSRTSAVKLYALQHAPELFLQDLLARILLRGLPLMPGVVW